MADKRHRFPVLLVMIFSILSSCAFVKENRDPCPCRLEIRLTGTAEAPSRVLVNAGNESWNYSADGDTVIVTYVPRGKVSVTAWSGASEPTEGCFIIPDGSSAPPLYLCHCTVDASGDEVIAHARLRKQYCTLQISVDGPPGWGEPFGTAVRGGVTGISTDGVPLEGPFNCNLGDHAGNWSLRIPRQDPASPLFLDIVMADSVVRTFSLGSCLQDAGFDWSAPDLGDLDLQLRLSVTSLTIRPPSWEPEVNLSIVI